jgi:hypothetical protein
LDSVLRSPLCLRLVMPRFITPRKMALLAPGVTGSLAKAKVEYQYLHLLNVSGAGGAYRTPAMFCNLLATGRLADWRRLSNLMPRYTLTSQQCRGFYLFVASLSEPILATDLDLGLESLKTCKGSC